MPTTDLAFFDVHAGVVAAFLQTSLGVDDAAWNRARAALGARTDAVTQVDSRQPER